MDAAALTRGLTTARFGQRIAFARQVDSTNTRALAALEADVVPEGTVFVAESQSRGRGTAGRKWYSDADGLWLTLVLQEPLRAAPLSFLPGIALVDVLRDGYGIDAHLKWPNDVVVEDRKLSGSLIESQRQPGGRVAWAVGIGINVNQSRFPEPIADLAVSLRLATGRAHRREELFQRLMVGLEQVYDRTPDLVPAWRARSRMLGRRIGVVRGERAFAVTALDLTAHGHLLVVRDDGGREEWVASADLRLGMVQSG